MCWVVLDVTLCKSVDGVKDMTINPQYILHEDPTLDTMISILEWYKDIIFLEFQTISYWNVIKGVENIENESS